MADNPIKGKLPFKIVSSSVNTGYQAELSASFKSNTAIFGIHSDEYGGLENEPLQSPFTKTHVGGNQHRHVELNKGNDDQINRPEAFSISASNAQLRVYGPDFSNKNNPRAQMFKGAKAPANIENIQSTTSSLNLGNFKNNYEVVQAVGRRNFNNLINDGFIASGNLTTKFLKYAERINLPEIESSLNIIYNKSITSENNVISSLYDPSTSKYYLAYGQATFNSQSGSFSILSSVDNANWSLIKSYAGGYGSMLGTSIKLVSSSYGIYCFAGAYSGSESGNSGSVHYVSSINGNDWSSSPVQIESGSGNSWFGAALDAIYDINLSKFILIVGAPYDANESSDIYAGSGSVYFITSSNGTDWSKKYRIMSGNSTIGNAADATGLNVCLISASIGYQAFAGAVSEDDPNISIGNIYVVTSSNFDLLNYGWTPQKTIASGSYTNNNTTYLGYGGMAAAELNNRIYLFFAETGYDTTTATTYDDEGAVFVISSSFSGVWDQAYCPKTMLASGSYIYDNITDTLTRSKLIAAKTINNKLYYAFGAPEADTPTSNAGKIYIGTSSDGENWQKFVATQQNMTVLNGSTSNIFFGSGISILDGDVSGDGINIYTSDDDKIYNCKLIESYLYVDDYSYAQYTLPEIKNNSKSIFVERFSAPGGKLESSRGALDREGEEYSPNNSLTTRNIKTRQQLYSQLTKHTPQFGSSSLEGITEHKVHRNTQRRVQYSGSNIITASDYDNFWVQHAIPRSDMQYSWITASAENSIFEYEKLNINGKSEDIQFGTTSYVGENSVQQDINGINLLNKENFNIEYSSEDGMESENKLNRDTQYPNFSYFNGLYQHSSWKQIRTGEHPAARKLKKENIFSIPEKITEQTIIKDNQRYSVVPKRSSKSFSHKEPLITNKYKPIIQDVIARGSEAGKANRLKYTFTNEKSGFANKQIDIKLGTNFSDNGLFDKIVSFFSPEEKESTPFEQNVSLEYSETVYPSEKNTFLAETRERTDYILDQAGTGSDGYDKVFGTQRVFWRENLQDRQRTPFEALNSQGYKNVVTKFTEQSASNYYSQLLYNAEFLKNTSSMIYGNSVSFISSGSETYGIIGSAGETSGLLNFTGSFYLVSTTNGEWQKQIRLFFPNVTGAYSISNVTNVRFGHKVLLKYIDNKYVLAISDPYATGRHGANPVNAGIVLVTSSVSFPNSAFSIGDDNCVFSAETNDYFGYSFDIQKINNTIYLIGTALDGATGKLFYTDIKANGSQQATLKQITLTPSPETGSKFGTEISVLSSSNKVLMFVSAPSKTTSEIYLVSGTESATPGTLQQFVTRQIANISASIQGYGNSISSLSSSNGIYLLIGSPLENSGSGKAYLVTSSDNATTFSVPLQLTYSSKTNEYFGSHVHVFSNSSGINFAISAPGYNNCGAVFLYKSNNGIINTSNYEIFGQSKFIGDNFGKSFDFIKKDSSIESYVAGDYGNTKRGSVTKVTNVTQNVIDNQVSDFGLSIYPIDQVDKIHNYETYDTITKDNTYSLIKNFTLNGGGEFNKEILTKIELSYFTPSGKLQNIINHNSSSINSFSVIYIENSNKYLAAYSNYTGSNNSGSVTLLSKSLADSSWGVIKTYVGKQNENFGTSLKLVSSSYGIYCFVGADNNSSADQSGSIYCITSSDFVNWSTASLLATGSNLSNFGNSLDVIYDQNKMLITVGAFKEPQYYEYRQQISNINGSGDKDYLTSSLNLTSLSPSTVGYFANSLAITGNNLLVSEHFYQYANNVTASGIVLVHSIENDGKILYKTNITSSDKSTNYYEFGKVVKVSPYNNLVGITAQGATVAGINGAGKIHLYKLNDAVTSSANWKQIQELTSSTKKTDARFGVGLKFYESGTNKYLFAGSYNYDNTSAGTKGKFEAFYSGTNGFNAVPIETAVEIGGNPVTVNMREYGGYLGHTIEIMENLLLVSQHSLNAITIFKIENMTTSSVYLIEKTTISPPDISDATNSGFGLSMAVSGNYLFVGAPNHKGQVDSFGSGSVYKYKWNGSSNAPIFTHEYSNYQQNKIYLNPPYITGSYLFGDSLVVSGNSLYIGTPRYPHDNSSTKGIGAAYRYDLSHYKAQQGAAYVITSSNGINWSNKQKIAEGNASYDALVSPQSSYGFDYLGSSVSVISCSTGYQAFVAAPYEDNPNVSQGNLYVMTSSDGINWSNKLSIASGSAYGGSTTLLGRSGIKAINYKNKTYVFFAESDYDEVSLFKYNFGAVFVVSSSDNNLWNQTNVQKTLLVEGINENDYLPSQNYYSNLISTAIYITGSGADYKNRLYYAVSNPTSSNGTIRPGKVFYGYTDDGIEWKKFISSTDTSMNYYTGSFDNEQFGTVVSLLTNVSGVSLFTANSASIISSSITSYSITKAYEEVNVNKNLFSVSNLKITPANLNNLAIPSVKYINNIDGFKYTTTGGEKSSIDYGLMRSISNDNQPFYDSYGEYIEQARGTSKEYSILPEFKISEYMEYYLNSGSSNFLSTNLGFLTIDGAKYSSSLENNFKIQYMIGDSLTEANKISTDYKDNLKFNEINLKISGIKKLLPYNGFYPIQRTIQLANLFSSSFKDSIIGGYKYGGAEYSGTLAAEKAKWYAALQPFFAPGILFNTIKSGIAVDFPVFTGSIPPSTGSTNETINFGLSGAYTAEKLDVKSIISGSPNYRFPFESIIDPTRAINDSSGIPIYYTMNYNSSSYNIYPYFKLTPNARKNYGLAMSNFLAETVRFFLKGDENSGQLNSMYSAPQTSWQNLKAGKTYYMDVSLRKSDNLVMIEAYQSNIHETGLYGQKMNGRYFGFPMSLSTSNAGDPNLNYGYCDPAYAAYTPPYFEGESIATIEYTPTTSGKPTLEQIIEGAKITYKNIGLLNYSGSNAANSKMTLDASVNLLGRFNGKVKNTQGTYTNEPNSTESRMVIHTKFETPVLNFKNQEFISGSSVGGEELQHGGFGRGMWSGYGEIPNNENIQLSIRETYPDRVYTSNPQTGSLITALGFNQQTRNIGTIAENRKIYEAIVAIPYLEINEPQTTINAEPFNKFNIYPIKLTEEAFTANSGTVKALKDAMSNYIFPPQLDFIKYPKNSKYAAYVFEIQDILDQQDLADIWQGLSPKSTKVVKEIGKQHKGSENDIFEINHENNKNEVLGVFADKNLPGDIKWMLFKVKRRGEYDYYKITDTIGDDENLSTLLSDPKTGNKIEYSYNWPHDFFSLVENAKLDVTLKYKKKN